MGLIAARHVRARVRVRVRVGDRDRVRVRVASDFGDRCSAAYVILMHIIYPPPILRGSLLGSRNSQITKREREPGTGLPRNNIGPW